MKRALCLLTLTCALFVLAGSAQAQVYIVSEVYPNYSTNVMQGYSATQIDFTFITYYGGYVKACLYDGNGNQYCDAAGPSSNAYVFAELPGKAGSTYTQAGDHYLICYYQLPDCGWYDPLCLAINNICHIDPGVCYSIDQILFIGSTSAKKQFLPPEPVESGQ